MDWQLIETVPVDHDEATGCSWVNRCLVFVPTQWGGTMYVAQMDAGDWIKECAEPGTWESLETKPTHWLPLPMKPGAP